MSLVGRHAWVSSWLALLAVFPITSCDTTPDHLRRDIQERRLEEIGMEAVDPSGGSAKAGVSVLRDIDVVPMDRRRIGTDTASKGFRRYVHRCGTCHSAPSPGTRKAAEWRYVFPRMQKHVSEAGLIPLGQEDESLILEFLERNAADR